MDVQTVPQAHREAAEEIRAHLVALRGGAPFLSPADALQLVQWLDAGVGVPSILRALERAAEARRKSRSRVPFGLGQARRHLNRPTRGAFARERPAAEPGRPLGPVVRALRTVSDPVHRPAVTRLAERLQDLEGDPERVVREALACVRDFFDELWERLGEAGRREARAQALDELGDVPSLVDEGTLQQLVEEGARDLLRQGYPWLSAASLWEVLDLQDADEP